MLSKLRSWFRYFYKVPWCVPAWGLREFLVTAHCIFTGQITDGHYPKAFADAVRDFLGIAYALPVNRGRVAIELALRAMGLSVGDDVVLPSYVCHSVLDAFVRVGARPVFADIGPDLHLTLETVKAVITPQTKCVIVPHLFSKTAPIHELEKMLQGIGIWLIDDAAQMFGSRCSGRLIGTFGDCGIVSCGPGKALAGAAGGLLVTNNRDLYEKAASISLGREKPLAVAQRVLSFWLWRRFRKYTLPFKVVMDRIFGLEEEQPYIACTMSNVDGAIALAQFHSLRNNDQKRCHNAHILLQSLGTMATKNSIHDFSHDNMYIKLVIVLPENGPALNQVISSFANIGIECQGGYIPLHQEMKSVSTSFPSTESLWDRVLCIPVDIEYKDPNRLVALAEGWLGVLS